MSGGLKSTGICINCLGKGQVGEKCHNPNCARRDYGFIPQKFAKNVPDDDPFVGRLIDGFLLVKILGKGGFGTVYLAMMMPGTRQVAFKILNNIPDEAGRERFIREARSLAMLENPHIVKLKWYGDYRGRPYMAMEYVDNARSFSKELRDRVRAGRVFSVTEVSNIIHQLLDALQEAHLAGIIHRDIKPDNILLQKTEQDPMFLKVLDFGLAKFTGQGSKMSLIMGTPRYMAPEQFTKNLSLGPWTDLYAVTVLAFELMTGCHLFSKNSQEAFGQKMDVDFDPLANLPIEIELPDKARIFFRKGIAKLPENRFRDTESFRKAFDELLESIGIEQNGSGFSAVKLNALLNSSDIRRVHEGSIEKKSNSSGRTQDEEQEKLIINAESSVSDAGKVINYPWYKNSRVGFVLVVMLGMVIAGAIVLFRSRSIEEYSPSTASVSVEHIMRNSDKKKQDTMSRNPIHSGVNIEDPGSKNTLKTEKQPKSPQKKVIKPNPRIVEMRPVYELAGKRPRLLPNVKVLVDGKLVGVTTRARGVVASITPGTHRITVKDGGIKKKVVNIAYSRIKGEKLDIKVDLSW